jgi:hypothetical protein
MNFSNFSDLLDFLVWSAFFASIALVLLLWAAPAAARIPKLLWYHPKDIVNLKPD